jgi:hypothetical protein
MMHTCLRKMARIRKMPSGTDRIRLALASLALVVYAVLAALFVWQDGLATFASDAGNYLLMARYLSPWQEAPVSVVELWDQQYFPPLFPLLLGFSGLSWHLAAAHLFTLFLLLAAVPLLHRYWQLLVPGHYAPLLLTGLFLISPGTWLNIMGILSENLFLLLSLAIILRARKTGGRTLAGSLLDGTLLAALVLTRSIGIAMVGAWVFSTYPRWRRGEIPAAGYVLPVLLAAAFILLDQWWQPQPASAFYLQQLAPGSIGTQLTAFNETWHTAWQFYWTGDMILPSMVVTALGCLALAGLGLRLWQGQLDAWYLLFTLLILLVWPYPGQGLRFLYVIQPLLLGQAWYALHMAGRYWWPAHNRRLKLGFLLLLCAVIIPAQFFLLNRFRVGMAPGYAHIYEFYNYPELPAATRAAAVQVALANDMAKIRAGTAPDDIVAWFEPVYLPVLAGRRGSNLADLESGLPDFIYLSRFHPRYSTETYNGLVLMEQFSNSGEIRWSSSLPDGSTGAVLLEMKVPEADR